ncbi:MAG TPA: hypothetical protein VNF74_10605 [Terriglobales bacterium]|nr:hypothetical protein [Terriglobales bacterium]
MATPTLRELDRRLEQERGALAQTADALRQRLRRDLHALAPRQQLQRHAGAAVVAIALFSLITGHIAGRILAALRR